MSKNRNGKGILIQGEGSRKKSKKLDHTVKIEEMSNNRNEEGILIPGEGSRQKIEEFDHNVKIEEESSERTPYQATPPLSLWSPPFTIISSSRTPVTHMESVEIYRNLDPQQPYVKPEESSSSMAATPRPPPPPPVPISDICSICLGTMVEETTTECGHLFCSRCIRRAISVQERCPQCLRRTTYRKLRRVFFRAPI